MALGRSVETSSDAPAWAQLGKENHGMAREQTAKERAKSYIAALEREAEGYEAKVRGAKEVGDKTAQAHYEGRVKQVQAEIARAKKEGQTPVSTDEVEADNRPEEQEEE